MDEELNASLIEEVIRFKTRKQLEHETLMAKLFATDRTLDDSLSLCSCGGKPRTRYAKEKVWIECKSCGLHSDAESVFPLARDKWDYVVTR